MTAAIGHNQPPSQLAQLGQDHADLHDRAAYLMTFEAAAGSKLTPETAGRVADLARMAKACIEKIDEAHEYAKAPYLAGGRVVDAWRRGLVDDLARLAAIAHNSVASYLTTHGRTRIDTGQGGTATLQRPWVHEVTGATVDLETLRPHLEPTAVRKAIRSYIRAGGRELAGVRIYQQRKALIR